METRSQARSRCSRDRVASSRANPPGRVSTLTSEISQQSLNVEGVGDASASSTGIVGGCSVIPAEGNSRSAGPVHICRSDCETCPALVKSSKIISNFTFRQYSALNIDPSQVHCKLQNYIYLCTCLCCGLQYVGESVLLVNLRMNIHRTSKTGCTIFINHFSNVCKEASFSVQILEKLPGNGYKNDRVDEEMRAQRLEKEDYWMKALRTVYPYGLNEHTKFMNEDVPVGRLFYPLPRHGTCYTNERTRIRRSDTPSHSDLNLFMSQTNFKFDVKRYSQ